MITDNEKWHYLAVKSISGLLRGITSIHVRDFYCLNCFHSYTTEKKLKNHEKICKDHDFCQVKMPNKNNKILKYNPGEKSLKGPFIIYADLECLLRKIDTCQNNPEKSYTEKKAKHKPSGYSRVTCCSFDKSKTEWNHYRGKDCMEIFCKDLRDQAMKIINHEKKKEVILTNEEKEPYEKQRIFYICKEEFCTDKNNEKEFKRRHKVRDHDHYTGKYREAAHSICNFSYKIPKEIPVVFHNGSTYDYHFIIRQLAKEFKGNFECLGENMEKYINFLVPIKKERDNDKAIIYRLKFVDSYRFMSDSLSSLVDNLSGIDKKEPENKFIDNMRSMMASLSQSIDKVLEIDKKISQIELIELMEKFPYTYQLCNKDLNKFSLLLRKGIYPYQYMDRWERFNKESLPDKESVYSELNKEDITDEEYENAQKVWKVFRIKNLGEDHDLYVQSDTLLLAGVFENFRDKCIEIYELDPAYFLSAPGIAWQACLKKTGVKVELLTDNDMLNMYEEGTRGGMCHAIHRYAKANNKYMKNRDKNNESLYLEYLDANNLYGWAMIKKTTCRQF